MSHIVIVSLPYHDSPQERKCKPCLNKWLDKVFDENVQNLKQIFEMTNSDNVHINQNLFLAMIPILALFSRFLLQGLGVGRTILISEDFIFVTDNLVLDGFNHPVLLVQRLLCGPN